MTEYMEYIKGGDILIAPSLDYKHQYIFKCDLCQEYYGTFEEFFSHYLSHYEMEPSEMDDLSISETMDEQQLCDDIIVEEGGADEVKEAVIQNDTTKAEDMSGNKEEDTISFLEEEFEVYDENVVVEKQTSLEEVDVNDSTPQETELDAEAHDDHRENIQSIDVVRLTNELGEETITENKSNNEYVKMFMKSKENILALIEAYRNEPHLWNFSLPVQYRKQSKRIMTWNKIATGLNKTINVPIKSSQVASCIIYLRQRYRERKRNDKLVSKNSIEALPAWAFKELHFLNSFVERKPIALLDIHQDMSPKQTIQILNIYKSCSHLWDTSTIEYYCTNKRNEALTEMNSLITELMNLEIDENTLRNYIHCVRNYVVEEKRRKMRIIRGVQEKVKYYDHLIFLYDHVGPYKCSHCHRTIISPLTLKAHESQHDGTIPFTCALCKKEFKLADTYLDHIRRHMGDLHQECTECGKKFLKKCDLVEHMRCHTGDKPFCCEICGASFRQRTGFGMHMKRHGKKYISFCPYCSKGFYSKDSMNMHARSHTDERDYVCPTCGKAFKTRKTLKSHVAVHENGNYECSICGKSFKNRINLWQHTRKHRLNSNSVKKSEFLSAFDTNKNYFDTN